MSLERLFAYGPNHAISAQDVFTNRESERVAFQTALSRVRERHADLEAVQDLPTGRRNVLVYHGMGGVGKSALSRQLQQTLLSGSYVNPAERRVAAHLDFGERANADSETLLLRLRACLGQLGRPWPAFDIALASYWERRHPGVPLGQFLDRESLLRGSAKKIELADQVQDAVGMVLGASGVSGAALKVGQVASASIRERVARKKLLSECRFFEPILEADSLDEIRMFLPVLLAWDLAMHQRRARADVVVFLDTFEAVQAYGQHVGSLEDVIARLVYLMPNVLFVISGRNRLDWADYNRHYSLKYAGPGRWPDLDRKAQHLLGGLSFEDCEKYLRDRLVIDGGPAIPADIRHRIAAGSGGLPLYLDLAAVRYEEVSTRKSQVDAQEFGGGLPELVHRVTQDLPSEERQLLRVAALVTSFDARLLQAAVTGTRHSVVDSFITRNFVRRRDGWLPFSLHDTVRASVQEGDRTLPDRWSQEEWAQAAVRIVEHLGVRVEESAESAEGLERGGLVHAFTQGVRLVADHRLDPQWLFRGAEQLSTTMSWSQLEYPAAVAEQSAQPAPAVLALARTCSGFAQRVQGNYAAAAEDFRAALAVGAADGDWLRLHYGEALLRIPRLADAHAVLAGLTGHPLLGHEADHYLAVMDEQGGRYRDLAARVKAHRGSQVLMAFAWHQSGLFAEAAEVFHEEVRDVQGAHGLDVATAVVHELSNLAFLRPHEVEPVAAEVIPVLERFGRLVNCAQGWKAVVNAKAGYVPRNVAMTSYREAERCLTGGGAGSTDLVGLHAARCFLECVYGDVPAAEEAKRRLDVEARYGSKHVYSHIATAWIREVGGSPGRAVGDVQWLDSEDDTLGRWVELLRARRRAAESMP